MSNIIVKQNEISTYLEFANLQIAAEALYGLKEKTNNYFNDDITEAILTFGNGRSSKFTPTQAAKFIQNWKVVSHIANTTTGFSGTLFEALEDNPAAGIVKGQKVLSFRSTEFIDDAARDNPATNTLEITEKGFAFRQITDMGIRR